MNWTVRNYMSSKRVKGIGKCPITALDLKPGMGMCGWFVFPTKGVQNERKFLIRGKNLLYLSLFFQNFLPLKGC